MKVLFKEVCFQKTNQSMVLEAPWIKVEFDSDPDIENLLLNTGSVNNPIFQDALESFRDFSIFYEIPRSGLSTNFIYKEIDKSVFPKTELFIDKDYVLSKSLYTENQFDPLTLFQLLEKECVSLTNGLDNQASVYITLENIRQQSKPAFEKALIFILNQTYYITKNFSKVVNPGKDCLSSLKNFVEEIHKEETGHHKLILESLSCLDANPEPALVLPETKQLIDLLSECVKKSHTSFSIMIGQLEGNHYPDKDPLAEIIEKSHIPKAAEGLNKHFKINKDHNHKGIGFDVANGLKAYINQKESTQCIENINIFLTLTQVIDSKIIEYITTLQTENENDQNKKSG